MTPPTVSRLVHFFVQRGTDVVAVPAIIAEVDPTPADEPDLCHLFIIDRLNGYYFKHAPRTDEPKLGRWMWPPMVGATLEAVPSAPAPLPPQVPATPLAEEPKGAA